MENRINIGELDTRVIVEECVISSSSEGAKTKTYVNYSRPFAKVEKNIDESIVNSNLEEGKSLVLTMYKIPEMTTRWRIQVGDVHYAITSIDPIGRMSPLCTVRVTAI